MIVELSLLSILLMDSSLFTVFFYGVELAIALLLWSYLYEGL
jgi:hypothetical protein